MKAIAIDDEPLALEVIKAHASKVPFVELAHVFTDALKALEFMQKEKVDLLFLDIKMPDISGIEFFESLSHKPLVIFTTAYSDHAVTSFDLDAVDYLLKPFSLARFIKGCNKAQERFHFRQDSAPVHENFIFIKDGYDQLKVMFDNILYLEAAGNYVTFQLKDRKILTRSTLNEAMNLLPKERFIRVHRSYAVALEKVQKIERHQVTLENKRIPISGAFRKSLQTAVENSSGKRN